MTEHRNSMPKISIITPSYNQAQFLEETLDSVLSQGYPNLEYIVMDGGSTDGSVDIIRRCEKHLAYWQSKRDGGQSAAINAGFKRATGDILCWVNSDDQLAPGALYEAARILSPAHQPGWVIGACDLVDANGVSFARRSPPQDARTAFTSWSENWFAQQSTFWTRALWQRVGKLNERLRYAMDYDLWLRMYGVRAPQITHKVLSAYRFHEEALCSTVNQRVLIQEQWRTLRRHRRCIGLNIFELQAAQAAAARRHIWLAHLSAIAQHFSAAVTHMQMAVLIHKPVMVQWRYLKHLPEWIRRSTLQRNPLRLKAETGKSAGVADQLRVVFSLPNGIEVGGVTTWSFELARRLNVRGFQSELIEHARNGVERTMTNAPNVWPCSGAPAAQATLGNVGDYSGCYSRFAPCIFVPNWSWGSYAAATLARNQNPDTVRIIGFAHTDESHYYELLQDYAAAIDLFVAVSDEIAMKLKTLLPFRAADILTRPYAVEVPRVFPERENANEQPLRLVYAGRFEHKQKRVYDLIRLAETLHKMNVPFILELIGEGSAREELQRIHRQLPPDLGAKIRLKGRVHHQDMPDVWRSADLCILTSEYEGTSIAMLEAMAQGCLPVVTRVSGTRGVIKEGANGFTVTVGDMEAMAATIAELHRNRPRLAGMRRSAHATVQQHYSYDGYVDWFVALCQRVSQARSRNWPSHLPLPLPAEDIPPWAFIRREVGLRTRVRKILQEWSVRREESVSEASEQRGSK